MNGRISFWIIWVSTWLIGCGGSAELSGPQDEKVVSVETEIDVTTVVAGTEVEVVCTALDSKGRVLEVSGFDLVLDPVEAGESSETTLVALRAGKAWVACKLANSDIVDVTPSEFEIVAGPVAKSVVSVSPPEIVAGESSEVSCRLYDEFENEVELGEGSVDILVTPADDLSISGTTISTTLAGEYAVGCVPIEGEQIESITADWVVLAGEIESLELRLDPEQASYRIDDKVTVTGIGVDQHGNEVGEVSLTELTIDPAEQHVVFGENAEKIRFTSEGSFTISTALEQDSSIEASVDVVVDQTPPSIQVVSPERGITMDGEPKVMVSGQVSDNLGIISWLQLNGEAVEFDSETGVFELEMPLLYGANMVWLRAGDPYGNERDVARTVVWSTRFYPLNPPDFETDKVSSGMVMSFTQEAIDDGDHDPENVDDLATVFEIVMSGIDLASMIGEQSVGEFLGCDYQIKNVSYDSPTVGLTLVPGGLQLQIVLNNFVAEIWSYGGGQCTLNWDNWWSTGPVVNTADSITVTTTMFVTVVDGLTVADADDTEVEIKNLHAGDLDFLGWIGAGLSGIMEPLFENLIETEIEGQLGDIFNMLALNEEFEIPSPIEGAPTNILQLTTGVSAIQMEPAFMMLTMDGMAGSVSSIRPNDGVLGSLAYEGCGSYGQPPTPPPTPLQIAMNDDLLNQLLFGIWDGGSLNLTLGSNDLGDVDLSEYGISDMSVEVQPYLPLIFNSCLGEQDIIQIGDMHIMADFKLLGQEAKMAFWIQGEAPVVIGVIENDEGELELGFELLDLDPLVMEVVLNEGLFEGDDASLIALMKEQMLPQMIGALSGGLGGFSLPKIDLSGISEGIPEGTGIDFSFSNIGREDAFLLMQGELN